jgi:hypothetical protein
VLVGIAVVVLAAAGFGFVFIREQAGQKKASSIPIPATTVPASAVASAEISTQTRQATAPGMSEKNPDQPIKSVQAAVVARAPVDAANGGPGRGRRDPIGCVAEVERNFFPSDTTHSDPQQQACESWQPGGRVHRHGDLEQRCDGCRRWANQCFEFV